jgi:hypothetical protein
MLSYLSRLNQHLRRLQAYHNEAASERSISTVCCNQGTHETKIRPSNLGENDQYGDELRFERLLLLSTQDIFVS